MDPTSLLLVTILFFGSIFIKPTEKLFRFIAVRCFFGVIICLLIVYRSTEIKRGIR